MSAKNKITEYLEKIIEDNKSGLETAVAREALDYHDPKAFLEDLLQHGCQSGMVGSLIYFYDTHRFFDKHYEEIETIRYDLEEDFGESLKPKGGLKNWYAWMAFEETARKIANDLELEI